jgi:hypothetical protein
MNSLAISDRFRKTIAQNGGYLSPKILFTLGIFLILLNCSNLK